MESIRHSAKQDDYTFVYVLDRISGLISVYNLHGLLELNEHNKVGEECGEKCDESVPVEPAV